MSRCVLILGLLALAVSCAGETSTPTQAPTIVSPPTATTAPTSTPVPTATVEATTRLGVRIGEHKPKSTLGPTATSAPSEPKEVPLLTPVPLTRIDVEPGEDLTWHYVQSKLYPHELACVEAVEDTLAVPVLPWGNDISRADAQRFACLERATARDLLVTSAFHALQEDENVHIPSDQIACVEDLVVGFDAAEVVASLVIDAPDLLPAATFMLEFFVCAPSAMVPMFSAGLQDEYERQVLCVQDAVSSLEPETMAAMLRDEDTAEIGQFSKRLWECLYATDPQDGDHAALLSSTQWTLTSMGTFEGSDIPLAGEVTLIFSENGYEFGGDTGCNSFGGTYLTYGRWIQMLEMWWTEAGCPTDELFEQEQRVQQVFIDAFQFAVEDSQLVITDVYGNTLIFSP